MRVPTTTCSAIGASADGGTAVSRIAGADRYQAALKNTGIKPAPHASFNGFDSPAATPAVCSPFPPASWRPRRGLLCRAEKPRPAPRAPSTSSAARQR